MSTYYLNSFDSTPLFVRSWDALATPKGLVMLCHDVGEHSARFEGLAAAFNHAGYSVIAYDQRAFGATSRPERLGYGDQNTFEYSVQDLIFLFRYYSRESGLPIFLAGQGYGGYVILSALQRDIIQPRGVLLLSVAKLNQQVLRAVQALAKTQPAKDRATTLGLPVLAPLSKETADVSDPLTGVVPTVQFDLSLTEGLLALMREQAVAKLDRSVPYALFAGMQDSALGKEGEGAVELLLYLRRLGFAPRFYGYEDARHDLLTHPLSPRYFSHMVAFVERITDA